MNIDYNIYNMFTYYLIKYFDFNKLLKQQKHIYQMNIYRYILNNKEL